MPLTTPILDLPYPETPDDANVPADMLALVTRLEELLGRIEPLIGDATDPDPGELIVVNGSSDPGYQAVTGDVTITGGGVTAIGAGKVLAAMLGALSVTTAKIDNLAVTAAKLANGTITDVQLANLAVVTTKLQDLAVTTAKLADNAVTNGKMADDSVNTAEIVALAVTSAKLANLAVTTGKIADGAVTNVKLDEATILDVLGINTATTRRDEATVATEVAHNGDGNWADLAESAGPSVTIDCAAGWALCMVSIDLKQDDGTGVIVGIHVTTDREIAGPITAAEAAIWEAAGPTAYRDSPWLSYVPIPVTAGSRTFKLMYGAQLPGAPVATFKNRKLAVVATGGF